MVLSGGWCCVGCRRAAGLFPGHKHRLCRRRMQHRYAAAAPALGEEEMLARLWLELRGQMEEEAQLRNGKRNEGLFISEYDTFCAGLHLLKDPQAVTQLLQGLVGNFT